MLKKLLLQILIGILALACGFLTAVYFKLYLDSYFNRALIDVPDLSGQNLSSARRFISTFNDRLRIRVRRELPSRDVEKGHIISQEPVPGQKVLHGKYILVTVSSGIRSQRVPELKGLRLRQARLTLSQVGLRLGHRSSLLQPLLEEGTVIAHFPREGDLAGKGEPVDVLVASAGDGIRPLMPRLTHYSLDSAREKLKIVGIDRVGLEETFSPGVPARMVLAQHPAPGRRIEDDQKVKLIVAKEMGLNTPLDVERRVTFDMPPGLTEKTLTVLLADNTGTRQIHSARHEPGERVEVMARGTGRMQVEFYLDDDPTPVHREIYE